MRCAMGLMCVVLLSVAGFADSVETIDGQTLEGRRVLGLPEVITLADGDVLIDVESNQMLSLELAGGSATVITKTSTELTGAVDLAVSSVTLVTETGEASIPMEQVARVLFDRDTDRPSAAGTSVTLSDGREFSGVLSDAFPSELIIDADGIRTTTRLRSMTGITFGDELTVETAGGSVSGELMTSLPSWTELETRFGRYRIPTERVTKIELAPSRSVSLGETPANTVGIGLKLRGSLPFVDGSLVLGNLGINAAIGFGAFTVSGLGADVTALWYTAAVRYIVRVEGLDRFVRPHVGGGIIGVSAIASAGGVSESASLFGIDAGVGIDVPLAWLNLPLTIFTGTTWSFLGGTGEIAYEFGVRLDFGL